MSSNTVQVKDTACGLNAAPAHLFILLIRVGKALPTGQSRIWHLWLRQHSSFLSFWMLLVCFVLCACLNRLWVESQVLLVESSWEPCFQPVCMAL